MPAKTKTANISPRRLVIIIAVFVAIFLVQQTFLLVSQRTRTRLVPPPPSVAKKRKPAIRIQGQWKAIRESLGLPPAAVDEIALDDDEPRKVRFKRDSLELDPPPSDLFFAEDALHEPARTYQEMVKDFQAIMVEEARHRKGYRHRS